MRLLLVTFLILGGAALATEYALLNVHRMQDEKDGTKAEAAPSRSTPGIRVRPLIPGAGRSSSGSRSAAGARVADLVDLYGQDPRGAASRLGALGTTEAVASISALYDAETLPERRSFLLEAASKSVAGRPLLFEVARGSGPEARLARRFLQATTPR